jgi:hypothetical protein
MTTAFDFLLRYYLGGPLCLDSYTSSLSGDSKTGLTYILGDEFLFEVSTDSICLGLVTDFLFSAALGSYFFRFSSSACFFISIGFRLYSVLATYCA